MRFWDPGTKEQKLSKCHVLVYVAVVSIDRGTDHFCCFASGPEIVFPFTVCKENSILTENKFPITFELKERGFPSHSLISFCM